MAENDRHGRSGLPFQYCALAGVAAAAHYLYAGNGISQKKKSQILRGELGTGEGNR